MFFLHKCVFTLLFFALLSVTVLAGGEVQWRTVSPAELAVKESSIEKDADAEAIFWEVRLDDKKLSELAYEHYFRVKIFTERGRERFSKFDIPFLKGKKVRDVAARVVKPDGIIVELNPQDVFEREIVKSDGFKIKAVSFAISGIEPGAVLEYRYREIFKNDTASGERLLCLTTCALTKIEPCMSSRTICPRMLVSPRMLTVFRSPRCGTFRLLRKNRICRPPMKFVHGL
jgi:hypothetical protein